MKLIAAEAAYNDEFCDKHGRLFIAEMHGEKLCRDCALTKIQEFCESLEPIFEWVEAAVVEAMAEIYKAMQGEDDV